MKFREREEKLTSVALRRVLKLQFGNECEWEGNL